MNKDNSTLLKKLHPKNLGFGASISLMVYFFTIVTMIFSMVVGFKYFNNTIEDLSKNLLNEASQAKKQSVNKSLGYILSDLQTFVNQEATKSMVENMIISFRNYKTENPAYFDPTVSNDFKNILKDYYQYEVVEIIENAPPVNNLLPNDEMAIAFQFMFMVENPHRINEKHKLKSINDGTTYGRYHSLYHNEFYKTVKDLNLKDIYLIDMQTGRVVYNVKKNLATGTDLYGGQYRQSGLALTYKEIAAMEENKIYIEDFKAFLPSYNQSSAFIGLPVTRYGERTGVLIAEIDFNFLTDLIQNNANVGLKSKIEYNIIGNDLKIRASSNTELLPKIGEIDKSQLKTNDNAPAIANKNPAGNGKGSLSYPPALNNVLTNSNHGFIGNDYNGNKSILNISPLGSYNPNWYFVSQINNTSISNYDNKLRAILFIGYAIIGLLLILGVRGLRKKYVQRMRTLRNSMNDLLMGKVPNDITIYTNDNIGKTVTIYNQLKNRFLNITSFSENLSKGNYNQTFEKNSDEDILAHSLENLKQKLAKNYEDQIKREKEDEIRKWINNGIADFNDYLRQENHDINLLSDLILRNLVKYIGASQGGIFLVDNDEEQSKKLKMVSAYAYDRKKYELKEINAGEGLIGSCFLERKPVYITDLPQDYLVIRSGLGSQKPKCLYLVPLIVDGNVMGIIELASIELFDQKHFDFIEKVTDNIAATFKTVRLNTQTKELLEISNKRANEISQQEEEMRQNMEEMQATQEELARLRKKDEERTKDLQRKIDDTNLVMGNIINDIGAEFYIKDSNGILVYVNKSFADRWKKYTDEMVGKPLDDFLSAEQAKKEKETDKEVELESVITWEETEKTKGEEKKYRITKRRFYIDTHQTTGILFTRYAL